MNDHYIRHSERVDKLQNSEVNRSQLKLLLLSDGRLNGWPETENPTNNCCCQSDRHSVCLSLYLSVHQSVWFLSHLLARPQI